MAKLWIFSDLHQEFVDTVYGRHPATRFSPLPLAPVDEFDVVIAAGDVAVPLPASFQWLRNNLPNQRILYVAGNHDFYFRNSETAWTMEDLLESARTDADAHGIEFLENDAVEIDGVRFLGATLWTDFSSIGFPSLPQKVSTALKGMNDYRQIMVRDGNSPSGKRRLRPEDTVTRHQESRAYLEATLSRPFPGKTVVITHHAPHASSLNPRFGGHLDWCFASDLSELMQSDLAPDLWIHGHVHQFHDYTVDHTRIVANPRGYAFVGDPNEGREFNPRLVIDTDTL